MSRQTTILIAPHKYTGAQEIMQRIRYGYELCPILLEQVLLTITKDSWNLKMVVESVLPTPGNTGRGMSTHYYTVMSLHLLILVLQQNFGLPISYTCNRWSRNYYIHPNSDEDTFATIWKESPK